MSIKHECDKCTFEYDSKMNCLCDSCLDERLQESYDEGWAEAKKEFEKTE